MLHITKLYVLSITNSEGYGDGTESNVDIFTSHKDLIEEAYYRYATLYKSLEEDNPEALENNSNVFYSKEEFDREISETGYVVVQLDSYHIQFEKYERTVEIKIS